MYRHQYRCIQPISLTTFPGGNGVDDGTRTHDDRNHNPGLYQLSYTHHCLDTYFISPSIYIKGRFYRSSSGASCGCPVSLRDSSICVSKYTQEPHFERGILRMLRVASRLFNLRVQIHANLARPAGLEPATSCLEGRCSIRLSYGRTAYKVGRGRGIRTPDPLLPKQMRYQTAPCPDINQPDGCRRL